MRYAIFSDIHGNLQAWNAIHRDMVELQADVLVCLGDVVGYGPLPEQVLSAIRSVTPNIVLGNHDAAAVGLLNPSLFNAHAESVINWTSDQLSEDSKQFLLNTPLAIEDDDIYFVHAEITEPGLFGYIETAADARDNFASSSRFVSFIGHTHHPLVFDLDSGGQIDLLPDSDLLLDGEHRYIINVGSVGEPRNPDDIRARYVIYDSDTKQVYFRRVEFDPEAYRRDLNATSLDQTPYFLSVVDHQTALETEPQRPLMSDMQAPATLPDAATRGAPAPLAKKLLAGSQLGTGPKPTPNFRRSPLWHLVSLFMLIILMLTFGYLVFLTPKDTEPAPELAAAPPAAKETTARPEKPTISELVKPQPDPELEPAPEKVVGVHPVVLDPSPDPDLNPDPMIRDPNSEHPEPENVVGVHPIELDPKPDPNLEPAPDPDPEPEKEEVKTIAYWRMEEHLDSSLVDWTGTHSLKQLTPTSSIPGFAPDPIPLTGDSNLQAVTLASWIEDGLSNAFGLTADRSFTFEGWIMCDRARKPIFVGGTKKGKSPGWRFDLVAAKDSKSRGSMRLQYQGSGDPISILTKDIEFYEPVPHHFAIVWDHDHQEDSGSVQIFFDSALVVKGKIPHARISTVQSPFQLGDKANPERVVIDEIRFSSGALPPREFLSRGRIPKSALPPAFMIDVGSGLSTYDGGVSPAHTDGAIPANQTTWIFANADTDRRAPSRIVKLASGEEYPIPLTIDLGRAERLKLEKGIVWEDQGGETIRTGNKKGNLFGLELMDSAQDPDGELPVGIRVRGLEAGSYTVYFSPLVADELGEDIRFGIGVDLASVPEEVTTTISNGMEELHYAGGTAHGDDQRWELDRNCFKRDVQITGPRDYVVAIVWSGKASTAIPFLQIVKHGPSALGAAAPIEFKFDDRSAANQARQPHPNIMDVSGIAAEGFVDGSLKIEPFGGSETTVHATVNPPAPGVKDYFHFSFNVTAAEVTIAGFSMMHAGGMKISSNVTLHNATGGQIGEIVPNFQAEQQLTWIGGGSLAGEEPVGIRLEPGTYQVHLNAIASEPNLRWIVDSVKLDFVR